MKKTLGQAGRELVETDHATLPAITTPARQPVPTQHTTLPTIDREAGFERVTVAQLGDLLTATKGAQIVTIAARTVPAMRKTENPYYGRLTKVARVAGIINWRYESAVNRQREREARPADENGAVPWFYSEARAWGQRLDDSPLVKHKGQLYLELKVERSLEYEYQVDGQAVEASEVAAYLPARGGSGRQEVERPVVLRDYKLESIVQITIGGRLYVVG